LGKEGRYNMRFEELEVWKRAAQLGVNIFQELKSLNDFVFRNQITKSGLSISSNIAEGYERASAKESLQFLSYARGSCGELRSQIYIGMKISYISDHIGKSWLKETQEISAMLTSLMRTRRKFLS
jgi:four helix bundle protein